MTTKEELHRLVDELPDGALGITAEVLRDLLRLLNTPEGEDPLSWAQILRLVEAKRDARKGKVETFSNADDAIRWLHEQVGRPD